MPEHIRPPYRGRPPSFLPGYECDSPVVSSDFDRLISGPRLISGYRLIGGPLPYRGSPFTMVFRNAVIVFFSFCCLHTSTFQLLDKPWSQVSSLLPPCSCLQFLSRRGFSNPTARRFFIECCSLTPSRFPQVNLCARTSPIVIVGRVGGAVAVLTLSGPIYSDSAKHKRVLIARGATPAARASPPDWPRAGGGGNQ